MSDLPPTIKSVVRVAGGLLVKFTHESSEIKLPMQASLFLPTSTAALDLESARADARDTTFPVLIYLSGLTCTDDNVCLKGGAFQACMTHGVALLCPDTSPRGAGVAGEGDSWDFGTGAGFYLDATATPWKDHYRMYSYVVEELPRLLRTHFGMYGCDASRLSITGHSMGGHGALVCAIRNPRLFRSVSAFAPICNPSASACAWGTKAFSGYLLGGAEEAADPANGYDASILLAAAANTSASSEAAAGGGGPLFDDILVDIGTADTFLKDGQLRPEALQAAALAASQPLTLRMQAGYDHSYYFVSTFLPEHVAFHAERLLRL